MLAARVHSPVPEVGSKSYKAHELAEEKQGRFTSQSHSPLPRLDEISVKNTPEWQIPSLTFRPMSFMSDASTSNTRPKTSEARSSQTPLEIQSPVPKRPTSSQSRRRFSKILDIESTAGLIAKPAAIKQNILVRHPTLRAVEESPVKQKTIARQGHENRTAKSRSPSVEGSIYGDEAFEDKAQRISGVTSHDKSTVESLLDKHIECLGLNADSQGSERTHGTSDDNNFPISEGHTSSNTSTTIRLTDILANIPIMERGRPTASASQQYSSLATLDRQALKPRKLFASMDARVPGTIEEQSFSREVGSQVTASSRPSYGWQTLPSSSLLGNSVPQLPTLASGELADVETSETTTKLRVKRRSLLSGSPSEGSMLSNLSSDLLSNNKICGLHKRSKSEIIARQASHRRRRIRIRLRMKTRSRTTGDLLKLDHDELAAEQDDYSAERRLASKEAAITSLIKGYAELSGDSVPPSHTNLASKISKSPPIPTRWSSIIAAMPQPGRKSHEVVRNPSARSHRSQRSNTSIVEPVNTTRIRKPLPRMDSVPRLGPPDFGPPLTSSELNLSIPYAEVPSTIRPTLRETKSFFSDDSSAQRQRGTLRQKLHLHSLRNVIPASGLSSITPTRHSNGVAFSHSCQMKGRISSDDVPAFTDGTVPMTDFQYRRRRVMGKLKDWWKRQCLQKVVHSRKRKERTLPGGMPW